MSLDEFLTVVNGGHHERRSGEQQHASAPAAGGMSEKKAVHVFRKALELSSDANCLTPRSFALMAEDWDVVHAAIGHRWSSVARSDAERRSGERGAVIDATVGRLRGDGSGGGAAAALGVGSVAEVDGAAAAPVRAATPVVDQRTSVEKAEGMREFATLNHEWSRSRWRVARGLLELQKRTSPDGRSQRAYQDCLRVKEEFNACRLAASARRNMRVCLYSPRCAKRPRAQT